MWIVSISIHAQIQMTNNINSWLQERLDDCNHLFSVTAGMTLVFFLGASGCVGGASSE